MNQPMHYILIVSVLFVFYTAPASAIEDEAMEAQRCVWRCLANSSGADDPAYGDCVDKHCSEPKKKPKKKQPSTK
jgi:hypothetical protein